MTWQIGYATGVFFIILKRVLHRPNLLTLRTKPLPLPCSRWIKDAGTHNLNSFVNHHLGPTPGTCES